MLLIATRHRQVSAAVEVIRDKAGELEAREENGPFLQGTSYKDQYAENADTHVRHKTEAQHKALRLMTNVGSCRLPPCQLFTSLASRYQTGSCPNPIYHGAILAAPTIGCANQITAAVLLSLLRYSWSSTRGRAIAQARRKDYLKPIARVTDCGGPFP